MDYVDPVFDLIYALIIVCNQGVVPQCDVDHAIWADQSNPAFTTMDNCFDGAEERIVDVWKKIPVSGELSDYIIQLVCTETLTDV
jgi:hypothetical protein